MKRSGVRICTEDDDRDKGCVAGVNILRLCRTVVGFGCKVFWVKKMEIDWVLQCCLCWNVGDVVFLGDFG